MKLPPSPNQRIATALRQVTPAHAGGRTNLVAPTPTLPASAPAGVETAYVPLDPWGVAGAATFPLGSALWHGVYTDGAAAAGGTGRSVQFGLGDTGGANPQRNSGFAAMADSADSTQGYAALYENALDGSGVLDLLGFGSGHLTATATSEALLNGDAVNPSTLNDGHWFLHAEVSDALLHLQSNDVQMNAQVRGGDSGGAYDGHVELYSTNTFIGLEVLESGTLGTLSWLETFECSTDPPAPAANGARVYAKDNGGGKTQLCVRFNTGAVQVIATQP